MNRCPTHPAWLHAGSPGRQVGSSKWAFHFEPQVSKLAKMADLALRDRASGLKPLFFARRLDQAAVMPDRLDPLDNGRQARTLAEFLPSQHQLLLEIIELQ